MQKPLVLEQSSLSIDIVALHKPQRDCLAQIRMSRCTYSRRRTYDSRIVAANGKLYSTIIIWLLAIEGMSDGVGMYALSANQYASISAALRFQYSTLRTYLDVTVI